ncbi:hypothetical protein KIH23_07665 [Flavobacterium sp. CYK-55]|uniref:hypothetical protein n=1 Tax=Flavobacterium sp. CYK-55 TaxID=2835529 RepID=UPI001BCD9AF2|nr:hypothetical protein [Flavobacterium sp. CYK-55]MBS7787173.1 hypothetical protein [Flavobacterium sp. CYK-55]
MKKTTLILFLAITSISFGQKKWFSTYQDSIALVKDAKAITEKFTSDLKKIDPTIKFDIKTILNTTPYLIFFYKDAANIPLWEQVIPEQKQFFYQLAGNETEGKKIFGLFFNGFYLPHELGHAFDYILHGDVKNSYESEYLANTIGFLWWKKQHRNQELKKCYEYAKKMWAQLPNPVPEGSTVEKYFAENYEQATQDPFVYGYLQFKQFIDLYESKNLPDFDTFIKNELNKK